MGLFDKAKKAQQDASDAMAQATAMQQAAGVFPGQPLLVVTGAGLRHFGCSHPPLPATVTWQVLPDTTAAAWLAAATRAGDDSLQLLVGRSSESGTTYRRTKAARPLPGQPLRVAGLGTAGSGSTRWTRCADWLAW